MSVSFDQRWETLESIPEYVKIKTNLQKPFQYVKKQAHLKKREPPLNQTGVHFPSHPRSVHEGKERRKGRCGQRGHGQ
jgi:hypothetical protein